MVEVNGEVTAIEVGFAWISQARQTCSQCDPKLGCKSIALSRLFCVKEPAFRVQDPIGVKVGEKVWVGIAGKTLLQSAWAGYGMPVSGLLAGALVGLFVGGEYCSVIGGIAGLGAAMWWLKRKKLSSKKLPIIVRRA
jgi:sigma-E factor negative regulatory protein RseC